MTEYERMKDVARKIMAALYETEKEAEDGGIYVHEFYEGRHDGLMSALVIVMTAAESVADA